MAICANCGSDNVEGAKFCSQCGQRLPDGAEAGDTGSAGGTDGGVETAETTSVGAEPAPVETTATISMGGSTATGAGKESDDLTGLNDADAAAVDALPSGSALLIVQRGPGAGSRYLLDTDLVTAGRHPESDIFLDDITVSRRHVEFRRGDNGYTLHDVGSLNGTYVNRDRTDDIVLQNGDEVRIGKFRLIYFTSDKAGDKAGDRAGA